VILLKLKSSKVNVANLEKSIASRLPDNLQFLNIRLLRDVILLINPNEELPFTISPIRKFVNFVRLEKPAGIGPSKEFPWKALQVYTFRENVGTLQVHFSIRKR
jgi:hypothetical protein